MANVSNYHVLFYGSTDGYQGNRAQIALYDGSKVLGYDLMNEAVRRTAMEVARDNGDSAMTDAVTCQNCHGDMKAVGGTRARIAATTSGVPLKGTCTTLISVALISFSRASPANARPAIKSW